MMLRRISLSILILAFASCGISKKQIQTVPKPNWVTAKPIDNDYYFGVGSAIKTNEGDSYMKQARNNALASLSSDISVSISSQSILHKYENKKEYVEDYQKLIRTTSSAFIDGFELVDTFDDGIYYWEYYRLLKSTHEEARQQSMKDAKQVALKYLINADSIKEQYNVYNTLSAYLKALEAIKPFWGEPLEVNYHGQSIFLGSELFSNTVHLIKQISIRADQEYLKAKTGKKMKGVDLRFSVLENNVPLKGIPIVIYAGDKPLKNNKILSDGMGRVVYRYNDIPLNTDEIKIKAKLDINRLANSVTADAFFRKILRSIETQYGTLTLHCKKPTIRLKVNVESKTSAQSIEEAMVLWLKQNSFPITKNAEDSDFILQFQSQMVDKNQDDQLISITQSGSLKLIYGQDIIVNAITLPTIEASHKSESLAVKQAYSKYKEILPKKLEVFLNEALD